MLNTGPPIMQVSFVEAFRCLQDWEQTSILSSLQRLVTMMDAGAMDVAPILDADAMPPSEGPSQDSPGHVMEKEDGKNRR